MMTMFWILSFVQGFSFILAVDQGIFCASCGFRTYITFDYNFYPFMGKECVYDMAHDCSGSNLWSVTLEKRVQELQGTNELMLAKLTINYDGETIVFNQIGQTIEVGGQTLPLNSTQLPYNDTNGKFTIERVCYSVQFKNDDGSLAVAYNFKQNMLIELLERWRGKVCGLCGTFNGNKDDDIPEDTRDYEVSGNCGMEFPFGVCRSEEDLAEAYQVCTTELQNVPGCSFVLNEDWIRLCTGDYCAGHNKYLCQYLMEFQDVCYLYLRDNATLNYQPPPCIACGTDRDVVPTLPPIQPNPATECGQGGGFCLDPDCDGCIRPFKEGTCPADTKCCPPRRYPPFCTTSGFRWYITTDFNYFRYLGKEGCEYDMAHDCSEPRLWAVSLKKKTYMFRGTKELMIDLVKIYYDGTMVLFKLKYRKIKVAGHEWKLKDLPVYTDPSNRFTIRRVGYTVQFQTRDQSLTVTFNFRQLLVIDPGEKWRGKVCGICDTFDGDLENDLPKDATDFELGHHCGHEVPYGMCRSDELKAEAEEICRREFLAVPGCNIMLNEVWMIFCIHDYCSGGNKYLCQYMLEFGDYCHKILGVDSFDYVPEPCRICNMDRSTAPQYSNYNAYEDYDCELVGGNCISPTCDGCIHPFSDLQCPKGRKCCPDRPGKKTTIISQIQSAP